MTFSVGDYKDVPVREGDVIYCDIPYENTTQYYHAKGFDHRDFYEWARSRNQPVYISSYEAPEDFAIVAERRKAVTLSAVNNGKNAIERIFVHKGHLQQTTLF